MLIRIFDIVFSGIFFILLFPFLFVCTFLSSVFIGYPGIFLQSRVGLNCSIFTIHKIRTICPDGSINRLGRFFRISKIDELPQLFNILIGDMSFVGPRPDTEIILANLDVVNSNIFRMRPGLTGPAQLLFINEDALIRQYGNDDFISEVLIPNKILLNNFYYLIQNLL